MVVQQPLLVQRSQPDRDQEQVLRSPGGEQLTLFERETYVLIVLPTSISGRASEGVYQLPNFTDGKLRLHRVPVIETQAWGFQSLGSAPPPPGPDCLAPYPTWQAL